MAGITIQIMGDGSGAQQALEQIEARMRETAATGSSMASDLAAAGQKIQMVFGTLGIAVGVGAAVQAIREAVTSTMELGVQLGNMSKQTGISVGNLSALKYAADETGVNFDSLSMASKKLATSMVEAENGNKATIKNFAALGISQSEVKENANDLYGMMQLLATKFQEMPDGPQKLAAASALLGRGWRDLLPLLDQGGAKLVELKQEATDLGLVFSDDTVKRMEEMHQSVDKLKGSFAGLTLEITSAVEPPLSKFFNQTTDWVKDFRIDPIARLALDAQPDNKINQQNMQEARDRAHYNQVQDEINAKLNAPPVKASRVWPPASAGGGAQRKEAMDDDARYSAEMYARDAAALKEHFEEKARLEEEQARASLSIAQSNGETRLAMAKQMYERGVISEKEYLDNELSIRKDAFEREKALIQQQTDTATRQRNAAPEESKERMAAEGRLVELQREMAELVNREQVAEADITTQVQKQQQAKAEAQAKAEVAMVQKIQQQGDAKLQSQNAAKLQEARDAAGTFDSIIDQISSGALRGKESMRQAVDSMVSDLVRLSLKLSEPALIKLFAGMMGGGTGSNSFSGPAGLTLSDTGTDEMIGSSPLLSFPAAANGGDIVGPTLVGESGPEIFSPSGPGTITPNSALADLAKGGGANATPNVTINNVNNSSQPVQMKQTGVSYDAEMRQFVVHTVLEDMSQGGPMSQAMQQFGGN
jgi:hypothetical protein